MSRMLNFLFSATAGSSVLSVSVLSQSVKIGVVGGHVVW